MTLNKKVKNEIDNLKVDDEFTYKGKDYIITDIEDNYYELASTTVKERYVNVTYDELFDYLISCHSE